MSVEAEDRWSWFQSILREMSGRRERLKSSVTCLGSDHHQQDVLK